MISSEPNTIKAFEVGMALAIILVMVGGTYTQYVLHQPYFCWECFLSWDAFVKRIIDTWTAIIIVIPVWVAIFYIKKRIRRWKS